MSASPTSSPAPALATARLPADAEPVPEGSRWETVTLLFQLAGDLASVPFHLVVFLLFTRRGHRRRFLAALGRTDEVGGTR